MSKTVRQSKVKPAATEPELPVSAGEPQQVETLQPPLDPALLAATRLIVRALQANGTTIENAGGDGVVALILVPTVSWTEPTRDAWKSAARNRQTYFEGDHDRFFGTDYWMSWAPTEASRPATLAGLGETFARTVAKGKHCAAFTADILWLPSDIVDAADHRLVMPLLNADDVAIVARELCGDDPTELLSDEQAAALTPKILQLARRLGQPADTYIRKLRDLLERAAFSPGAEAAASPRNQPTLARLHGADEAVTWGLNVARDLEALRSGTVAWGAVDRGCLLSGPPGCGKTLFARALATTCGVPLVSGSYGAWHGSGNAHQGDLLKAMRRTFSEAAKAAPCILFLDEIDSFPNRGTITHQFAEWEIQVVNALLMEIDGADSREGVIVLAACNNPDRLDPALTRSGRLDRHIRLGLPDRGALVKILREHLGVDLAGADLSGVALTAAGCTGADCERYVRGARRRARLFERAMILADLAEEILGLETRTDGDMWVMAIHEAGHAVASCTLRAGSIASVNLRGGVDLCGRTETVKPQSVFIRAADVRSRLIVLLSGRAAEEEIFGVPSSGAGGSIGSDLEQATSLAVQASTTLGFDEAGGLLWRNLSDGRFVSQALTAEPAMAERVRHQLDEAYASARAMLRPRLDAVRAVAAELVANRVLDGIQVEAIIQRYMPADGRTRNYKNNRTKRFVIDGPDATRAAAHLGQGKRA